MDTSPAPQKKGLSGLAWVGIGCGGVVIIGIIIAVVVAVFFGPKIKQFAQDAAKDPTRATATAMVSVTGGKFEMVAEDEPGKRYTLREKATGKLITIYWNAKEQKPVTVEGDFSVIPPDANPPATPSDSAPK